MTLDWQPPAHWTRITSLDSHTGGEPFRVVTGGFPELAGDTMLARRRDARRRFDHLRRALMWEPRGHADMYGCLVTPPATPDGDCGILFLHNEGFSTMCGHGVIAFVTVALETGLLAGLETAAAPGTANAGGEHEVRLRLDTPAGRVTAYGRLAGGRVTSVRFRNVPSFVVALDEIVEVPGIGRLAYDLAFGGAFYAIVDAAAAGVDCVPDDFRQLVERGTRIKRAIVASRPIEHPFEEDLAFLYGVIFVGPARDPAAHSRNVCVFADGEIDRSPTGTGVSARLAIHHARGELAEGERIVVESLLGSRFRGRVLETCRFGPHAAVVPEVEGSAHLTGRHEFWVDPDDPLADGFLLR